jgi:hypothetical protein
MVKNPVIKWGAIFFALFFIYTATADASVVGSNFASAGVDLIQRVLQFITALLDGASSA